MYKSRFLDLTNIKRRFKQIDIGGVPPTHTVDGYNNEYKSVQGGIMSLVIMTLSAAYTFYIIYTWVVGQILPKSQTSTRTQGEYEFSFDYNPISFDFIDVSDLIDPFQNDQVILIPIVSIVNGNSVSNPELIVPSQLDEYIHIINLNGSLSTQNLSFVHNPNQDYNTATHKNESQYLVTFLKCSSELLQLQQTNQTCANELIMESYLNQTGKTIAMSVYFEEFVESNQTFVYRTKQYYFIFDDTQGLYAQVILRTKQLKVQHGILFQKEMVRNYLQSVELQTQTISKNEIFKLFGFEGYAFFLIRLDSVKEFETISYPTLGEVGAQIGSIVNIILWARLLINLFNENRFQNKLMSMIITSTQNSNNNQRKQNNQMNQVVITKELASKQINIFNLHIELANMRLELNQLMEEKYEQQQLKDTIVNLSDKKQYQNDQNKIIQNPVIQKIDDAKDLQIFTNIQPIIKNTNEKNFINQPFQFKEIELCPRNQVNLMNTDQGNQLMSNSNNPKTKIKKIQQNPFDYLSIIENMEYYQKYEIYQEEPGK